MKDIGEGLVGAAFIVFAILTPFLRSRRVRWGTTKEELERTYPGDELIPHPKWEYTHAVTIHAPAADVWPWVVQIGQGRGGFYSYEWLENIFGCAIHNADRIIPEFQNLEAGDTVRLHPKVSLPVIAVQSDRFLLLGVPPDYNDLEGRYAGSTWLFCLYEINETTTRLFSHGRSDYSPRLGLAEKLFVFGPTVMEPLAFVMGRKMLLGIKKRAEAKTRKLGSFQQ